MLFAILSYIMVLLNSPVVINIGYDDVSCKILFDGKQERLMLL
jgi:hypothetical protein